MRRPTSLRARAALSAALAAALVFGAGGWWLRGEIRQERESEALYRASQVAESVAASLQRGERVPCESHLCFVVLADGRWVRNDRDAFVDARGHPVIALPPGMTEPIRVRFPDKIPDDGIRVGLDVAAYAGRVGRFARAGTGFLPARVIRSATGVKDVAGDQEATVYVLARRDFTDTAVATVDRFLAWTIPAAILFVGIVAWLITGRAMRPVAAMRAELAEIGDGALDRRVPVPAGSAELAGLAGTTNQTLDRLERAVLKQRRFVADASHELRSPLTGLRSTLEVPLVHPDTADWRAVVTGALADTVRLQALTDDLLLLAAENTAPPDTVDLAELAEEQVAERECRPGGPAFTVRAEGPAVVRGGEHRLGRIVRNLLDNAARHAASRVAVTVASRDGTVTLTVADDGPGVPASERERIFDRFVRLDDARARATGGAGLGLTIVRELVTAHGGTVRVTGSATFEVRLPAV
ncbi:sensor histidine kinase [Spirillospora sp. CA-294931]|uniref:sensor histidine kinase n=1 Tax=Spirillospora sp. CA-294931 TaxID=3240042 RepID=UPI003D91DC68